MIEIKRWVWHWQSRCNRHKFLYTDPTTGLDPITADSINELINKLKMEIKITFIAVTHDMTSAHKISDWVAMLHDAGIIGSGIPDEIKNSSLGTIRQFIGDMVKGHTTNF